LYVTNLIPIVIIQRQRIELLSSIEINNCNPISQELFDLLEKWKSIINDESYILRSISRHGYIGKNLNSASINTILKALQKDLNMDSYEKTLSGHSFRVVAALDLLEQGEPLEKIMLRGRWQTD
jgi:hypothetical protein